MPQNPTSLPFLVSYADTLSSAKSRPLIQTALTAIASLQEIDCVCIDNITLPDDIAEAGARLGAYTTADLVPLLKAFTNDAKGVRESRSRTLCS